jgi:hypothetical protein
MYNVSAGFKEAIKNPSRVIGAKVEIGANTYFTENIIDISYEDMSNPSSKFTIGSTVAAKVDLSLIDVTDVLEPVVFKPYLGVVVNGNMEYVPLGVFYADDVERKKNVARVKLFDGMVKLEKGYFSDLTYPATITQVMNEIASKAGVTFTGTLPDYQISDKPEGYTYREVVGMIAQMCGGFAKFNRDGQLTIKSYADTQETYDGENYIDYEKRKDRVYRIDKITVQVGENILSKGTLNAGGSEISFENPFFTESILTEVYNQLNGFNFLPTWVKMQGNPAFECGDIVTLTTIDNEIIRIPIMSFKLNFNGGLTGEMESVGESENKNSFNSSGSLSKKVERVYTELALINEALVNKLDVEDLNAVNAIIQNLQSDIAEINHLLAGNITAENIQTGAITAGSGIIAEGAIGDAEISDLNANKIIAGTVDTSKVTVAGPDGRLQLKGNKLQVFDLETNGQYFERVMLGIDEEGNSALILRGADGQTVLLTQDGLTEAGFTEGYNKLENDSLDPVKIDISQVVERINNGTTEIIGSKILLDNKTLDVQFNDMKQTLTEQGETLDTHSSQIQENANQIGLRVLKQTYESDKQEMESRLSNAEGSIDVLSDEIQLKVSSSEVQTMIDEIEVGVRNLIIRGTETKNTWINISGNISEKEDHDTTDFINVLPNTEYTFSKSNSELATDEGYFRWAWYDEEQNYIDRAADSRNTFTWKTPNNAYFLRVSYPTDSNPKLERGNIASDWSPAPEDVDQAIEDVNNNLTEQINTVVEEYNTAIELAKDEISLSVEGMITDSENRITEAFSTELEATREGVNIEITRLDESINNQNSEINTISSYFNFTETGLGIGKSDSPLNISISNEQIDFMDSGAVVAFINGKKMYIDSLEVLSNIIMGVHKIEKYNNDITLIKWVGE